MYKRVLSIVLCLVLLLTCLVGCEGINSKPKKDYGEYPKIEKGSGYTVTGKVTDAKGNAIPGVAIFSGDVIRGLTNESGEYKITGLSGDVTIKPAFANYTFTDKEKLVSKEEEVNFVGKNDYTLGIQAITQKGTPLYQANYEVNGKTYSAKRDGYDGVVYIDNLNGLTKVKPISDGFDFIEGEKSVYKSGMIVFTARPKAGTYSVSGKIDMSAFGKDDIIPKMYVTLDGEKYADVNMEISYDYSKGGEEKVSYSYSIEGLNPEKKYSIGIINDKGEELSEKYIVDSETKKLDFIIKATRQFTLKISIWNKNILFPVASDFDENKFDYYIRVNDENGNRVKGSYGYETKNGEFYVYRVKVWQGCTINILGEYYDLSKNKHFEVDERYKISSSIIRDYKNDLDENGNYILELDCDFYQYVEDDDE